MAIRFTIRAKRESNDLCTLTLDPGRQSYDMDAPEPELPPGDDEIYHVSTERMIPLLPRVGLTREEKQNFITELRQQTGPAGYKVRRIQ